MSTTPRPIWAYTYTLVPPRSAEELRSIRKVLDNERRAAAVRDARWEARLVNDERISHILVLSDSPDVDVEVNNRLEAALRAIGAGFAITVPMAVESYPPAGIPRKD